MERATVTIIVSLCLWLICQRFSIPEINVFGQLLGSYPVTPYGVNYGGGYPPGAGFSPSYFPPQSAPPRYPPPPAASPYSAPPYAGSRPGSARPPGYNPGFAYAPPYKVQYGNSYAAYLGYYPLSTNYSLTFGTPVQIGTLTQQIATSKINASQSYYPPPYGGGGYPPYGK